MTCVTGCEKLPGRTGAYMKANPSAQVDLNPQGEAANNERIQSMNEHREALARAWDEGAACAYSDDGETRAQNPYRTTEAGHPRSARAISDMTPGIDLQFRVTSRLVQEVPLGGGEITRTITIGFDR